MVELAVIADDFTGALDTGIKFAKAGMKTQVMLHSDFHFSEVNSACEVLVIDTETRHLKPESAYQIIYTLVKRCRAGHISRFYKKTDSALRGCIGKELTALCDALGESVEFIPALPEENRITENGIQYVNQVPVAQSIFGKDPFEPVRHSRIADIIHEESEIEVVSIKRREQAEDSDTHCIRVYDASTEQDILDRGIALRKKGCLRAMAGCSGFAAYLPEILGVSREREKQLCKTRSLFILCGSVNKITEKQLICAQKQGFQRICLNIRQKLQPVYFESEEGKEFLRFFKKSCRRKRPVILDVISENAIEEALYFAGKSKIHLEEVRSRIAKRLGELVNYWLTFDLKDTLVITGGDTVYAFLSGNNCSEIEPVCEVIPGVVLFHVKIGERKLQVISKSGGFGNEQVFLEVAKEILIHKEAHDIEEKLS